MFCSSKEKLCCRFCYINSGNFVNICENDVFVSVFSVWEAFLENVLLNQFHVLT